MEFVHEETGTKLTLPERPTVYQQLMYSSALFDYKDENVFWRNWLCAQFLIENWESEIIPERTEVFKERLPGEEGESGIFLTEETDSRVTDVLIWAGNRAAIHIATLGKITKNE
jgi:hypothetical protein